MSNVVRNLAQDPFGKLLVGLAAAAVFTVVFWYFVPVTYFSKVLFGLALLVEGYRFYQTDIKA